MREGQAMTTIQIVQSRRKIAIYAACAIGLTLVGWLLMDGHTASPQKMAVATGIAVLAAIVVAGTSINPERLMLDRSGLTRVGGAIRKPVRVAWSDTSLFSVASMSTGARVVKYTAKSRSGEVKEEVLAGPWPGSAEQLVLTLNDARSRALASS